MNHVMQTEKVSMFIKNFRQAVEEFRANATEFESYPPEMREMSETVAEVEDMANKMKVYDFAPTVILSDDEIGCVGAIEKTYWDLVRFNRKIRKEKKDDE